MTQKRGKNFAAEVIRNGIYAMARQYADGKLPQETLKRIENTALMVAFKDMLEAERAEGKRFDVGRIGVRMNKTGEQRAWPPKAANFLKHADRDAEAHLAVDEVENENVLIGACAAYLELMRTPSPEIMAFIAFWGVKKELSLKLRSVDEPVRHSVCTKSIETRRQQSSGLKGW